MPKKDNVKPIKNVRIFLDVHRKLKIHVAKSGENLTDFVSEVIAKEINYAIKKSS